MERLRTQLAAQLGLPAARQSLADIQAELAAGPALIVLDNFETTLQTAGQEAAAQFAKDLAGVGGVAVLVSLREEPPGRTGQDWAAFDELQRLGEAAAAEVFVAIAGLREPAEALDYLLKELDGLPPGFDFGGARGAFAA